MVRDSNGSFGTVRVFSGDAEETQTLEKQLQGCPIAPETNLEMPPEANQYRELKLKPSCPQREKGYKANPLWKTKEPVLQTSPH